MSSQERKTVYQAVRQVARKLPRPRRQPQLSDVLIVAMYLWAVAHDRPQCWACDRHHYNGIWRPRRLASQSRLSRRLRPPRCQAIIQAWPAATLPPNVRTARRRPRYRKQNPHRLRPRALWPHLGSWALRERKAIDHFFGQPSSYGGGLAPRPAWVRTLDRVTRWVTAKIVLDHVRRQLRRPAA